MALRTVQQETPANTVDESAFAAWGRLVHRRRKPVLAASAVLLVVSLLLVVQGGQLMSYQPPVGAESTEAMEAIERELPGVGGASFTLVFSSDTRSVRSDAFREAMLEALEPLRRDARVGEIRTPYDVEPKEAAALISADDRHALAIVAVKDEEIDARAYYGELRGLVQSDTLQVLGTDALAINAGFEEILQRDLVRSEAVSIPITLILLLVVFGAVVAALLPVGVGVLAVLGGMAGVYVLSRGMDITVYATNIVSLIGLGVAIDYSLFIVKRYQEELAKGHGSEDALAITLATAGRATLFSGLTVAIGLAGLLFYQGTFFATMGIAGAIVVALAVLYALTFLPALLALLGPRVGKGAIRLGRGRGGDGGFWRRLATGVMRRPVAVFVPVGLLLLVAGAPFLNVELAAAGITQLPEDAESRRGHEVIASEFPDRGASSVTVVAEFPTSGALTRDRVGHLYDLSQRLAALPNVVRVESVVDLDARMTREDYQDLLTSPSDRMPPALREAIEQSVGEHIVLLNVVTDAEASSEPARDVVRNARALAIPSGDVLVTGHTAVDLDTLDVVYRATPYAVAFVLVATYVLILLQTGSVVLPLKAVVMNLLSITASFGAVVWVFQEGNLSAIMGFTPGAIDPSVPVMLFCIVFGLSMDYEVLLLSRIHEEYVRTGDNTQAVADGLEKSGRLITGAAAIMVVVFGAFAFASVVVIKAIGFGLALAVAIDATLVRALIVPATMRLMGKWNWWGPKFLRGIQKGF